MVFSQSKIIKQRAFLPFIRELFHFIQLHRTYLLSTTHGPRIGGCNSGVELQFMETNRPTLQNVNHYTKFDEREETWK